MSDLPQWSQDQLTLITDEKSKVVFIINWNITLFYAFHLPYCHLNKYQTW